MRRLGLGLTVLLAGCTGQDMDDQPRYEALEASTLFEDGASARPLPQGVVAHGTLDREVRPEVTPELLTLGRERFDIFCSPCHGRVGDGTGMVVQRGFPAPPSYHTERLRAVPDLYFYEVITNGYGVMYSYASRVPPRERWAIAAYIRALQLSQHAAVSDLPEGVAADTLGRGTTNDTALQE